MKKAVSLLHHLRDRVFERPYIYGGIVVAILLVWWLFGSSNSGKNLQTLELEQTDFAPSVAVSGTVVAAQEVDLGFAESGRVTGVYAKVGSRIQQGQMIAHIENGDERAAVSSAQARLEEALAGTRAEEILIAEVAVEAAEADAIDAIHDAYRTADDAVRAKTAELFHDPRTSPSLTFITESARAKREVEGARASLDTTLRTWESELRSLTPSSDIPTAITRAQGVLSELMPFLASMALALSEAVADTHNTQTEIDSYVTDIASARSSVSTAQSALTTARSELESAKRSLTLKEAGSTSYDIAYERAQVDAARAALARTIITAPFSGTVSRVDVSVGEIVSPNTPQISMISEGVFQIESYVPEVNIATIDVGDQAEITLDAYGAETFKATIVSIDPAETLKDGVSTYKTTLQFTTEDPRIRSGMTANITITTEQKLDTLVVPQGALIRRGGETYIQVLTDKKVSERQVKTGSTALGRVEILSGVSAGEIIVLNPQ